MILLFTLSPIAFARSVSCLLDLKFYEKQPGADADKFLGYTSSRVRRAVAVPSNDAWYVRPVGKWGEEDFFRLAREMRDNRIPGLDLSNRWDVTNDTLSIFQDVYALRVLMLSQTRVTDAGLAGLEKLDHLGYLSLNNQITDAGLQHLSRLPLERLEVHGPKITDKGMTAIQGLAPLKSLDISDTAITDKGLEALAALPRLEALFCSRHITDAGMSRLARFKALRYLDVTEAPVTDAGVASLVSSAQLAELSLSGTRVGDAALKRLSQMKSLRVLDLSGTRVTPDGLADIARLSRLETVSLPWEALSEPEIHTLAGLPRLKQVALNGTIVTQETLARIHSMARLSGLRETAEIPGSVPQATKAPGAKVTTLASPSPVQEKKRTGGLSQPMTLPGDIAPTMPSKTPIALDNTPKGKGMEIEVSAGPSRSKRALSGLKRIHQAEIVQAPREPDLLPGESRLIKTHQENASNSLGEIEVSPRR